MDTILLLAILVIVIVLLTSFNSKFQQLQDTIYRLHEKINELRNELDAKSIQKSEKVIPEIKKEEITITKPIVVEEKTIEKPIEVIEKTPEIIPIVEPVKVEIKEEVKHQIPVVEPEQPREPEKSWFETFKDNNPDLEKFIGENLINKIGILILVLGISFFVKYAIDKDWINETARVGIGILAGSLVMGVAHKLRQNYKAFSSVMVAGAISIFYFTIAIAFHDYHLFSQTVAFAIMVIITAFSTFVSVNYDRQELAVLSLIGGFAVPFMVSTGAGNYVVLFTYIAILNIGILGIAYYKKWNLVTILSFGFSYLLLSSWYYKELYADKLPHQGAFVFATLYYFIFSIVVVLNNVRKKGEFSNIDYFMIIANTFVYFGLGMGILHNWGIEFKGLFTLSLAIYNLIYAIILFKKFGLDKNAVYLLIGLVLTFVTLTIPIQFNGNQITLFWAAEAVLLFWLSQKSKISLFKLGAMVVQFLSIISLIIDWDKQYRFSNYDLSILVNPIFITGIVVLASLLGTYFLLKKENESTSIFKIDFDPVFYRNGVAWVALILGYFVGIFEIIHQSGHYIENASSQLTLSVGYHFIFSTVFVFFAIKSKEEVVRKLATILAMINIALYVIWWHNMPSKEVLWNIANNSNSSIAFYFHYLILACLIYYVTLLANQILNNAHINFLKSRIALWMLVFCGVYILSNELIVHQMFFVEPQTILSQIDEDFKGSDLPKETFRMNEFNVQDKLDVIKVQVIKIGYPILWGILSFALLIFGIKKQWKEIRIIALSLLGLTIAKLFLYDINNVSETGKIIAFILLGVLILIISFVYQKIKKLVVDESQNASSDEN
jgi:hypothetical protein